MADDKFPGWHGTTILAVRRGGKVVVAGDGQVSLGNTVIKGSARKVRRLSPGGHDVVCGFAGSTADAFTLLERLEKKLESAPGQLARACVELAKDWRMDKYLRNLEAMLIVTDGSALFVITGAGDVLEPFTGVWPACCRGHGRHCRDLSGQTSGTSSGRAGRARRWHLRLEADREWPFVWVRLGPRRLHPIGSLGCGRDVFPGCDDFSCLGAGRNDRG